MTTIIDEWAEAARELAKHCRSRQAQRHGRFKAFNLPAIEGAHAATLAHKGIARALKTLMLDMQRVDEAGGAAAAHLAVALEALADALVTLPRQKETPPAPPPAPENIPYNPGAGA